jgi:hypothetical protein
MRLSTGNPCLDGLDGAKAEPYHDFVIPLNFRPLFWDVKLEEFDPEAYPVYTIERVLEHGDQEAYQWLLRIFTREQIREVIRTDRHLSPRSANFWALVFEVPDCEVAALCDQND